MMTFMCITLTEHDLIKCSGPFLNEKGPEHYEPSTSSSLPSFPFSFPPSLSTSFLPSFPLPFP